MNNLITVRIKDLTINPEVEKIYKEKNLEFLKKGMEKFGQQHPIVVFRNESKIEIVDGISRYLVAKSIGLERLICIDSTDITNKNVIEKRSQINQRTKRSIIEICLEAEHYLGILGKSQGKKRMALALDNIDSESELGTIEKDRYELACLYLGIDMKSSTLRKLMNVYYKDSDENGESITGVLDLLSSGKISIDKANQLVKEKERKEKEIQLRVARNYECKTIDVKYELYNKSSLNLDDLQDSSIQLVIYSPPYFQLREYRNQDELCHGQENTVKEYIENHMRFCREVRKKLTSNGVLVIIIGETYRKGYQGVATKMETALENNNFRIVDSNGWCKTNPKYIPRVDGFTPAFERIIVCTNPDQIPTFNKVTQSSSTESFKVIRGAQKSDGTSGFSMASPEAVITNVLLTPCFNKSEFKHIDPTFKHDAPAPMKVYETYIQAYSNPGDTVLDIFCGSGTGLDAALKLGRNAIGYDVDPVSIDFCKKRLDYRLEERSNSVFANAA